MAAENNSAMGRTLMSAYVVDMDLINSIVRFVADNPNCVARTKFAKWTFDRIGECLRKENVRSVLFRYWRNPAIVLRTRAENHPRFRYQPDCVPLHVSQIITALETWDYNACECDDYESSDAATLYRAIAKYAVDFANDLENT